MKYYFVLVFAIAGISLPFMFSSLAISSLSLRAPEKALSGEHYRQYASYNYWLSSRKEGDLTPATEQTWSELRVLLISQERESLKRGIRNDLLSLLCLVISSVLHFVAFRALRKRGELI